MKKRPSTILSEEMDEYTLSDNELLVSFVLELTGVSVVDESFEGHGEVKFQIRCVGSDNEKELSYEDMKEANLHHYIPFRPNNSFFKNAKVCEWDLDESGENLGLRYCITLKDSG